jgi:uncharacterized protein (TIRG00374 family)
LHTYFAKGLQVFIFFAVGILILYLVFQRQNDAYMADCALKAIPESECSLLAKIADDFSQVNYFWIALVLVFFTLSNVLRALRWQMMLKAIGYQPRMANLFGTIVVNYMANLGIPRSGEVIRAGLLSGYEDIPLQKVFGTIVTDRIFDVIMLLIFMMLAVIFGGHDFMAYLNENIQLSNKFDALSNNGLLIAGIIVFVCISAYVTWQKRASIQKSPMGRKVGALIAGFAEGVKSVKDVSNIPLFLFYTVAIWVLYFLLMYLSFFSFEPTSQLGIKEALVVFAFGSLGILIPTPGGMGSYHYLVVEALAMYHINSTDAFSFANIVFFTVNIFLNILFGCIALILLPILNKKK